MTWKELAEKIQQLDEDQKNTDVTIATGPVDSKVTEFHPVVEFADYGEEDGVLDSFHPVLICDID